MIIQTNIFEYLDDTLSVFQEQVNFPLTDCRKGHVWEEQNRQLWSLGYTLETGSRGTIEVQTMIDDHRIVFSPTVEPKFTNWNGQYINGQCVRDIYYKGELFCREVSSNCYEKV